jgi:hypothetical protein
MILATAVFTAEVIYCSLKGFGVVRHFVARGQGAPERRRSAIKASTDADKKIIKISS